MSSIEISEAWTRQHRELDTRDFFSQEPKEPFAFLYGDGPLSDWLILGWDPLIILDKPAQEPLVLVRHGEVPAIRPDFIGLIAYEFGRDLEPLRPRPRPGPFPFPDFRCALYRNLLAYHRSSNTLFSARRVVVGLPQNEARPHCLRTGDFSARKAWDSDTRSSYAAKVEKAREEIGRGNVYQVNVTRQERWETRGSYAQLAQRLWAANPAPYSALIADADLVVISSSPECFLRLREGRLCSRPIKGTAPRSAAAADDERLAKELVASPKNRAELAMIVDLVRNDLARICRVPSVVVDRFPELESYANVHHLVATISGTLPAGTPLDSVLAALFPAGSVTGCPKLAAMQLIHELEEMPRGAYTGAIGWFAHDCSQLELSVAIRTAFGAGDSLIFGVGSGIVWDSDPISEYEETVHKGRSIVQCLSW
jgi:anthranilate/para-aminobenzoate synthase component I